jgi:hypothetical protein
VVLLSKYIYSFHYFFKNPYPGAGEPVRNWGAFDDVIYPAEEARIAVIKFRDDMFLWFTALLIDFQSKYFERPF